MVNGSSGSGSGLASLISSLRKRGVSPSVAAQREAQQQQAQEAQEQARQEEELMRKEEEEQSLLEQARAAKGGGEITLDEVRSFAARRRAETRTQVLRDSREGEIDLFQEKPLTVGRAISEREEVKSLGRRRREIEQLRRRARGFEQQRRQREEEQRRRFLQGTVTEAERPVPGRVRTAFNQFFQSFVRSATLRPQPNIAGFSGVGATAGQALGFPTAFATAGIGGSEVIGSKVATGTVRVAVGSLQSVRRGARFVSPTLNIERGLRAAGLFKRGQQAQTAVRAGRAATIGRQATSFTGQVGRTVADIEITRAGARAFERRRRGDRIEATGLSQREISRIQEEALANVRQSRTEGGQGFRFGSRVFDPRASFFNFFPAADRTIQSQVLGKTARIGRERGLERGEIEALLDVSRGRFGVSSVTNIITAVQAELGAERVFPSQLRGTLARRAGLSTFTRQQSERQIKRAITPGLAISGFTEGALQEVARDPFETRQISPTRAAVFGGVGGVTAPVLGRFALGKVVSKPSSATRRRVLVSLLDPFEFPGDVARSVESRVARTIGIPSPQTTITRRGDVFSLGVQGRRVRPIVPGFAPSRPSPTQARSPNLEQVLRGSVQTPQRQRIGNFLGIPTGTPTTAPTQVGTLVTTPSFVPQFNFQAQQNVPTTTPSVTSSISIPAITPIPRFIPPIVPGLRIGAGRRGRGGRNIRVFRNELNVAINLLSPQRRVRRTAPKKRKRGRRRGRR